MTCSLFKKTIKLLLDPKINTIQDKKKNTIRLIAVVYIVTD